MRKGRPRSSFATSSVCTSSSSAPRRKTASCSWRSGGIGGVCYNLRCEKEGRNKNDREGDCLSKLSILAHRTASLVAAIGFGRVIAVAALSVLGGVAAFGLAPYTTLETVPMVRVARDLAVPAMEPLPLEDGFWR